MVDREHALGLRLIADRVGVFASGRLAALLQRLQIENRHAAGLAIGDESLAQIGGDGDAVHAVQAGDVAHHLAGVGIDHFHRRAVRNVQPAIGAIHSDVVPAAFAADIDLGENLVPFRGECGRRRSRAIVRNFFIWLLL